MEAVAHNPSFAKKVGIPQSVGKEFSNADKGKSFNRGGDMKRGMKFKEGSAAEEKTESKKFEKKEDMGMKRGGMMRKMAKGGETMGPRSMSEDVEKGSNKHGKHGESKLQKKGHTRGMEPKMSGSDTGMKRGGKTVKKMASGGSASARADGMAMKGKTKGRFI
jgi:hypothetical protein